MDNMAVFLRDWLANKDDDLRDRLGNGVVKTVVELGG
jgi:hypothetical protein